jgi:hypothetical protein
LYLYHFSVIRFLKKKYWKNSSRWKTWIGLLPVCNALLLAVADGGLPFLVVGLLHLRKQRKESIAIVPSYKRFIAK